MEFDIIKYVMPIMKSWKRELVKIIELSNEKIARTLGEKENLK